MKRILTLLLVLITVSTVFVSLPSTTASADSMYIKKIVSVVYDDSGSMDNAKWSYANYAMQTFCGMLNAEDQLYITYMSAKESKDVYTSKKIDLSSDNIQESVDAIKKHSKYSSGTPYKAVESAFNTLKGVTDENPNTQYWLVVITDGIFTEFDGMTYEAAERELDQRFNEYASTTMPNGTNAQVNFLAIGKTTVAPAQNEKAGIFTSKANAPADIIGCMSNMADKISGRTRLSSADIVKLDSTTIQVSSNIPLLNIAVLSQNTEATITVAVANNENNIEIARKAELSISKHNIKLNGRAYLLGNANGGNVNIIPSGTYLIKFNQEVDLADIDILYEPALEMRMTITVNGKKIEKYSELDNLVAGDKIAVSCKIYEMNTDKEISPSLLPPKTNYNITVYENDAQIKSIDGENMVLDEFTVKDIKTKITATVRIDGFAPIDFSVIFTPTTPPVIVESSEEESSVAPIPEPVYTINAEYGSDAKSVRFDEIADNKDLTVCFTVFKDGVQVTDASELNALNYKVTASPDGNSGTTQIVDGKIVFTPNKASPATGVPSYEVEVKCTIADGTEASLKYTVLLASYQVIAVNPTDKIDKTKLYNNKVSASFYILKDGIKLTKSEVENGISISFNKARQNLKYDLAVSDDGTITVTPYSTKKHELSWKNWGYYFCPYWRLSGQDIYVTLTHVYGNATVVLDVTPAPFFWYEALNVWLPLIIIVLIALLFAAYFAIVALKPKFSEAASLYLGSLSIDYASKKSTHDITIKRYRLGEYNKFKWLPSLKLKVSINGIVEVTAEKGNKITVHYAKPWYTQEIEPYDRTVEFDSPRALAELCMGGEWVSIKRIPNISVNTDVGPTISLSSSTYYLARVEDGVIPKTGQKVIDSAKVFCYSN